MHLRIFALSLILDTLFPLGHRYCPAFTRVSGLSDSVHVTHVGCGGEHTVFLSNDNDVYAAGN